ncbi:nucleoside 2-deoxyribosyltransferase [Desulfovibrio sp. OttesenSCG-928-G15]|nr:nucleoside 2-deoxyribosyltransferase [Desulfovibrio sp. OttesenSCG-928-G15]
MRIYIAASWKHQHAVEMLTERLEALDHEVLSWLREGRPEEAFLSRRELEHFIYSEEGRRVFEFCAGSATSCDAVIYLGPSGCDAWAEVGAAYGRGVPILGLLAKSEDVGLMRLMIRSWHNSVESLLAAVSELPRAK